MADDEDHRRAAAEYFRLLRDLTFEYARLQGDYGKWLIASLLLIHGGALYSIGTAPRFESIVGSWAAWHFVAGLIFALLCGFVTWLNWNLNFQCLLRFNRVDALVSLQWPAEISGSRWINRTFWAAIVLGFVSAILFVTGSVALDGALNLAPLKAS
jgi:hypothetical protein